MPSFVQQTKNEFKNQKGSTILCREQNLASKTSYAETSCWMSKMGFFPMIDLPFFAKSLSLLKSMRKLMHMPTGQWSTRANVRQHIVSPQL
jgi:hypothetical protein